jgi:predicted metal-binding transcription factor (methanogenesis marker protein 9)
VRNFLGKGGFHNVFGDKPTKWSITKNMHLQIINMDLQESMVIKGKIVEIFVKQENITSEP